MQSSTSTIIALVVAGILLFIAPLMTLTTRSDNVTQENVELIVGEFVTEIQNTGKLTRAQYQEFERELDSTGNNSYEIQIEIKHSDENYDIKVAQANSDKIGENGHYSEFKTQVLRKLGIKADNEEIEDIDKFLENDTILLGEGDIIFVEVKNTNSTAAQTLQSSFIGVSNADEYVIYASSSGMVTVNGR